VRATSLILLVGCTLPPSEAEEEPNPWTARSLQDGLAVHGQTLTLADVVVTSPATIAGTHFFVQDPEGGPRTGLRVEMAGVLDGWPPPIGTSVTLKGQVVYDAFGPTLRVFATADATVVDEPVETVVASPFDSTMPFDSLSGLVTIKLAITSDTDPSGHASTNLDDVDLADLFGAGTPGWMAEGVLTGIYSQATLSLRAAADWEGDLDGAPPVDARLDEVWQLEDGTPVVIGDALQATPWSRGDRWAVLQDDAGIGVWIDAEGWGLDGAHGQTGTWSGQVRTDGEGLRLRVWSEPAIDGARTPIVGDITEDGALITYTADELGPPDAYGERATNGELVLDDRFVDLSDLTGPAELVGAIRAHTDGRLLLAPWELP